MSATAYTDALRLAAALRKRRRAADCRRREELRLLELLRHREQQQAVRARRVRPEPDLRARVPARRGRLALVHLRARRVRARDGRRRRDPPGQDRREPARARRDKNGAVRVEGEPQGPKMGWMKLRRGHQALLPKHTAYRFRVRRRPGVVSCRRARAISASSAGPRSARPLERRCTMSDQRTRLPGLHARRLHRSAATSTSRTSAGPRKTAGR